GSHSSNSGVCLKVTKAADGFVPGLVRTKRQRSSQATSLRRAILFQPASRSTKNRLFCKRPVKASRPRPQAQVVLLLPVPVRAGFLHMPPAGPELHAWFQIR